MPRKEIAVLTDDEIEVLRRGKTDVDVITDYFFRKRGESKGWIFDYKFDPEGAWQKMVHHAAQRRIVVIGGYGSGKTRGVAISACVWSMTMPDFAFLNAAPTSWQSELMYKFIISETRGTPFERLIYSYPKRPYPSIEIRYILHGRLVISTMEFMSVDKNADQILSWEGDWVNLDEAGKVIDLGETIRNLGSRLRGNVGGRDRLGRMSLISNSWDNPELWYRFDLGAALPKDYLSLAVSSRHNHNITPEQFAAMLQDIPEEEHDQFIDAMRPEGRGKYFSKPKVYLCEDQTYSDLIVANVESKTPGYEINSVYGAGVVYFKTPRVANRIYMVLGDPGTDNAPNRNAPAILVWDCTEFPKYKANLVAAWWGAGNGSITPFIYRLLKFMEAYDPVFTAVDSTGPQKNTNQLLNAYIMGSRTDPGKRAEWLGDINFNRITNPNVQGMDFSGGKKPAYLVAGRLFIEAGLANWPKFFVGMRSQLTNYDPDKDKAYQKTKIAQDLVATFCMSAFAIRAWFSYDPNQLVEEAEDTYDELFGDMGEREARLPRDAREIRVPR